MFDEAEVTDKIICEDQPAPKGFAIGSTEESMMFVLGDIDAHDQMLFRSANKAAKLTKMLEMGFYALVVGAGAGITGAINVSRAASIGS